jgi:hypothetical protein
MIKTMKSVYDKHKNISSAIDSLGWKVANLIHSNPQEQNLIEEALQKLTEDFTEVIEGKNDGRI